MKLYTVGIGTYSDHIIMIEKTKPDWQKGLFNFPGGKFESWEVNGEQCISREWEEETGVKTDPYSWKYVGQMIRPDDFSVLIYCQENEEFINCKTMTEEKIYHVREAEFLNYAGDSKRWYKCTPNADWLYRYTLSSDFLEYGCHIDINYPRIKEKDQYS